MENMTPYGPSNGRIPGQCDGVLHQIKPGDTLYLIAKQYHSSIEALLHANYGIDPYNLQVGSHICIPGAQTPAPTPAPGPMPGPVPVPYPAPVPSPVTDYYPTPPMMPDFFMPSCPIPMPEEMPMPEITPVPMPEAMPMPVPKPVPAPVPAPMPAPDKPLCCPRGIIYTVKRDDTLTKILTAGDFCCSSLLSCNPGIDPYHLTAGQQICIPEKEPGMKSRAGTSYTTGRGDNLARIAESFKTSTDSLLICNQALKPSEFAQSGTRVRIPEPENMKK